MLVRVLFFYSFVGTCFVEEAPLCQVENQRVALTDPCKDVFKELYHITAMAGVGLQGQVECCHDRPWR